MAATAAALPVEVFPVAETKVKEGVWKAGRAA